jgi:hypothetical protein
MLTTEQQKIALSAPLLPLRFLLLPEHRANKPSGMESFSESACFHRLYDLLWTLREKDVVAILSDEERAALADFTRVFESLPWRVIEASPHISELPDDDLSPLLPTGDKLLRMIEARTEGSERFAWLRRLFGRFNINHR